ncbi:ATP-dependent nuclease [Persicimonas caeni]|nr:AAA family ATPase [Persicimonas caeni]
MGHHFVRLTSERDVRPEPASGELDVDPNGRGATNLIRNYLTSAELPHDLVEESMLDGLNEIFESDAYFTRIMTKHDKNETWEVFLEEDGKPLVRLSDSGSGLKTVLLVLTFLYLVPHSKNPKEPDKYFFGFEELENNLHPALQRRLFRYLRNFADEHGSHFFLTTHSNVVIDMFSQDDDAQILHVQREDGQATVHQVSTYAQQRAILDDLAVRASDLLQSNCIVWLEGPSDRLYFNRWVELWTDGELREGSHYQCVFYGGSLLAHYTAEELGASVDDLVEVLRVNCHAILMADSDRSEAGSELKPRLARIAEEMDDTQMYCWVTAGREVENYIPVEATRALLDDEGFEPVGPFDSYPEQINAARGRKTFDKVGHANAVKKHFTKAMLEETADLAERLEEVCEKIREWN